MDMSPVLIDTETSSGADLPSIGGRRYAAHSSTRLNCLVYYIPSSRCWGCYVPAELPVKMPAYVDDLAIHRKVPEDLLVAAKTHGCCAHNSTNFDAHIWNRFVGPEVKWVDSLDLARAAGLPGKLEKLGLWLEGRGKDKAGELANRKLMTLTWDGARWSNKWTQPGLLAVVIRYCMRDVHLLKKLVEFLDGHPYHDPGVVELNNTINARGIAFDDGLATRICKVSQEVVQQSVAEIERLSNGTLRAGDLRSQKAMPAWLKSQGITLANLQRGTIDDFLDDPLSCFPDHEDDDEYESSIPTIAPETLRILRLRKSCLRVTGSKLEAAILACDNGRLYDWSLYHGGHTGRFSSIKVQVHNLSSGVEGCDIPKLVKDCTLESVNQEATRLGVDADDILSSLIRPCFYGNPGLIISDLASIEGRGLQWLAGCDEALENYAKGLDPYIVTASRLYGVPYESVSRQQRKVGKIPELGCGYGMGHKRLQAFASGMGVDLTQTDFTADRLVQLWRDSNPRIAGERSGEWEGHIVRSGGLWKDVQAAFKQAISGISASAGRCVFKPHGQSVLITLPSGRSLCYRKARIEDRIPPWGGDPKPSIVYCSSKYGDITTHGGKLVENICQAVCRDILVYGLLGLEAANLRPVLHVHDEAVCEGGPELVPQVVDIMCRQPKWAEGFPIAAEGHWGPRYTKEEFTW